MHNASETELIELLKDTIEYLKKENESLKEEKGRIPCTDPGAAADDGQPE